MYHRIDMKAEEVVLRHQLINIPCTNKPTWSLSLILKNCFWIYQKPFLCYHFCQPREWIQDSRFRQLNRRDNFSYNFYRVYIHARFTFTAIYGAEVRVNRPCVSKKQMNKGARGNVLGKRNYILCMADIYYFRKYHYFLG